MSFRVNLKAIFWSASGFGTTSTSSRPVRNRAGTSIGNVVPAGGSVKMACIRPASKVRGAATTTARTADTSAGEALKPARKNRTAQRGGGIRKRSDQGRNRHSALRGGEMKLLQRITPATRSDAPRASATARGPENDSPRIANLPSGNCPRTSSSNSAYELFSGSGTTIGRRCGGAFARNGSKRSPVPCSPGKSTMGSGTIPIHRTCVEAWARYASALPLKEAGVPAGGCRSERPCQELLLIGSDRRDICVQPSETFKEPDRGVDCGIGCASHQVSGRQCLLVRQFVCGRRI